MIVKIQVRRGLSTQWTSVNPILSSGEFGYETDTGKLKIGNGITSWVDLEYTLNPEVIEQLVLDAENAAILSTSQAILSATARNETESLKIEVEELVSDVNILATPLTDYTVGPNTALSATDSILGAFGKVQGQISGFISGISGTIASGQVAFASGTNIIGGSSNYTYSATDGISITTSSSAKRPINLTFLNGSAYVGNTVTTFVAYYLKSTSSIGAASIQLENNATSQTLITSYGTAETGTLFGVVRANYSTNINIGGAGFMIGSTSNSPILFGTNNILRWSILNSGILQSNGSQTIQSSTGNITISSLSGNGSIILTPNGTGKVRVGGTIPNATGNFTTYSASGDLQQRTPVQSADDILNSIAGYNASVNQRLEHIAGVKTWVNI